MLLLNNDVVVTTGWLGRMLRALRGGDAGIGLVGPRSNFVSGPQQIEVAYDNIAELDGFAWDFGKAQNGVMVEVSRLVGFCLLIKREVIDAIGLLDEQFGIGCFEDDDYCLRAIAAGFRAVIAGDSFVHHFGSRTFLGSGVDAGSLMRENHAAVSGKMVGQRQWPQRRARPTVADETGPQARRGSGRGRSQWTSRPRAGCGCGSTSKRPSFRSA